MSSSNVTGEIDVNSSRLLPLQWRVLRENIFIRSSYQSGYHEIRSPYFVFERESWQISLDTFDGQNTPSRNARYPYFRVRIFNENGTEIPSCESKRQIFLSKAEIKIYGRTYMFRKIASISNNFILPRRELKYFEGNDYMIVFVDLGRKVERSEPEESPSSTSETAMTPASLCRACKCAAKLFIGLSQNLKDLYLNQLQCDLTIDVRQRVFQVHKSIVTARSPVFAAMMKHDMEESKSNVVVVTDCDPEAFDVFLLYLYSGETEKLSTENVVGVYFVADKYITDELKAECTVYMKANLCVGNFCDIVELASKYSESDLLKVSEQFFATNAKKIFQTDRWSLLMKENVKLAQELLFLLV